MHCRQDQISLKPPEDNEVEVQMLAAPINPSDINLVEGWSLAACLDLILRLITVFHLSRAENARAESYDEANCSFEGCFSF